jgi:hypothetical protein
MLNCPEVKVLVMNFIDWMIIILAYYTLSFSGINKSNLPMGATEATVQFHPFPSPARKNPFEQLAF